MIDFEFWRQERARVLGKPFNEYREDVETGNYLAAIDIILEQPKPYTVTDNGGAAREELVERAMAKLTIGLSPHERALVMGGVRIGALEAAHEIAQTYPQLAERIYAQFGMEGWK